MKKHINLIFAVVTALSLFACAEDGKNNEITENPNVDEEETPIEEDPPLEFVWTREVSNPLIVPKVADNIADFGPADATVMFDEEDNLWKMWMSSTLRELSSGNETMTIKYTQSDDGVNWSVPQIAFQVSADSDAWDHTHAETPAVIKNPDPMATSDKKYMLWYSGANTHFDMSQNRPNTFPYYQIGLAFSADGRTFVRHTPGVDNRPGLVLVARADLFGASLPGVFGDGVVADPEVIYQDGRFHIWFSSYAESVLQTDSTSVREPLAFGISHAVSSDGVNWVVEHDNPMTSLRREGELVSGQQPSVFFNTQTNQFEMWFSNDTDAEKSTIPCSFNTVNGFWHAVSDDGVNWVPDYSERGFSYNTQLPYEALGFLTGVEAVRVNNVNYLYYSSWSTQHIPNEFLYFCPDQNQGLVAGVLTLNRAVLSSP